MLSVHLIERYWRRGQFDQLLAGLSQNGLRLTEQLVVLLARSRAGAVALGLKRVVELSYGPTALSREMADQMASEQAADGSFSGDPLATGMAAAALGAVMGEQTSGDLWAGGASPHLSVAHERAVEALGAMQAADGLFVGGDHCASEERALVAACICWQLAGDVTFRQAVRFDNLTGWFEAHEDRLDDAAGRLWRMAQLEPALELAAA